MAFHISTEVQMAILFFTQHEINSAEISQNYS